MYSSKPFDSDSIALLIMCQLFLFYVFNNLFIYFIIFPEKAKQVYCSCDPRIPDSILYILIFMK